jgi:hypothetical protein
MVARMVRDDIVKALARAGHEGMMPAARGTTGPEVVSALFMMCAQGIEVGIKIGCTRESMRLAILSLYMQVADEGIKQ